jgi:hypothetical protein
MTKNALPLTNVASAISLSVYDPLSATLLEIIFLFTVSLFRGMNMNVSPARLFTPEEPQGEETGLGLQGRSGHYPEPSVMKHDEVTKSCSITWFILT